MNPSAETIKRRRQFFGIIVIGLLLIGVNSLAFSLMHSSQSDEANLHHEVMDSSTHVHLQQGKSSDAFPNMDQ